MIHIHTRIHVGNQGAGAVDPQFMPDPIGADCQDSGCHESVPSLVCRQLGRLLHDRFDQFGDQIWLDGPDLRMAGQISDGFHSTLDHDGVDDPVRGESFDAAAGLFTFQG